MTDWEVPWHCEVCDVQFKAGSGGGSCERCRQAICNRHLGVVTVAGSDTDQIICDACLNAGEETRPVRRKHYLHWFKRHNP